ncbi:hypothetical protein CMQ_416 [Grosmannia clavigera kw1407]|uniref:Uncharacterized protein n=1 Tax=Grosmannia clavigera (strain kw1407 / UAMH 11150) TaxID=655863 RepID=F0XDX4_GROCL|nr:uncharacterized protein CMQ_416 [Grosmannia clavigera kw1407]EFX03488.1 hypothetical protein CMQ_416 [Grosmannia clavigera kw1407]
MKTATFTLVASAAAFASAQVTYNSSTGAFTCAKPDVAYCAGDSLKTDIIIRCDASGVGQPGRCSDNLDGEPPVGNTPSLCWQANNSSGEAACEKNCVVYGGSGNYDGTFTLPASDCTPTYTASATDVASSAEPTSVTESSSAWSVITTRTSCSSAVPALATGGATQSSNVTIVGTGSGSGSAPGTATVGASSKTPVGPTSSAGASVVPVSGASINKAGGMLAAVGFLAAYFM